MKKNILIDLRILQTAARRAKFRTVNITETKVSIPLEDWWKLSNPSEIVLRINRSDLYIMLPTEDPEERGNKLSLHGSGRDRRKAVNIPKGTRRLLIPGRYTPKIVDVEGTLSIRCIGAVNEQLIPDRAF